MTAPDFATALRMHLAGKRLSEDWWDRGALDRLLRDSRCVNLLQRLRNKLPSDEHFFDFVDGILVGRHYAEEMPKLTKRQYEDIVLALQDGRLPSEKRLLPILEKHFVYRRPDGSYHPVTPAALIDYKEEVAHALMAFYHVDDLLGRPTRKDAQWVYLCRFIARHFEQHFLIATNEELAQLLNVMISRKDLTIDADFVAKNHKVK